MYQSDLLFYPDSGQAVPSYRFGHLTVNRVNDSFQIVYEPYSDALKAIAPSVSEPTLRAILGDLAAFLNSARRHIPVSEGMSEPEVLIALTRVLPANIHITTPVAMHPKNAVEIAEHKAEFVIA